MPSDLDVLIDYYQWEIQRLKGLIEEHKEMHFYEELVMDDRALQNAYSELDRLLVLKNRNHYKIQFKKRMIADLRRIEKKHIEAFGLYKGSYYQSEIKEYEKQLKELYADASEKRDETQILDGALYSFLQGSQKQLYISIDSYKSKLKISVLKHGELQLGVELWLTDGHENQHLMEKNVLRELQFTFNGEYDKYQAIVKLQSRKNVLPVKEFLARIIYGLKRDLDLSDYFYIETS